MTSPITVEPYETVEFPDSDTDSWQVVDPFDSDNDDVITSESDVVSSSDEEGEDEDEDVDIDDVIASESDVISSDDEDEDEEEEDDDDDIITSEEEEEEEEEEDDDDVIISEDEEDDVDEITNHTQELNKGYELDGLINGEGGAPYNVEISDAMKEDAYFEHLQLQRMSDEEVVEEQDEDEDEDEDEYDEDLDDELVPRWLNNKFERQRMRKLGKKVYPKMKKSKRMVNQYNRPGCAGAKHGLGLNNNLVW